MSLFEQRFLSILEADNADSEAPVSDAEAMQTQLDPGTDPKALNAQTPPDQISQARATFVAAQKQTLTGWIQKVVEFVEFLNGTNGESIQSKLAESPCDTLFEKIANSEKKRIARVAMELSSLNESFKGYLISGDES